MDIEWENRPANVSRARRLIDHAPINPGDLILLPEMFDTGFSMNTDRTADRDGKTRRFLADLALAKAAFVCGGTTVIDETGAVRNRAAVVSPAGQVLAEYDKRRLFPLGEPCEAASLTAGWRTAAFRWAGEAGAMTVSPLICYDLRFPDLFADGLESGAEAFAVIANWPAARAAHWRALLIARAIENQAFVFGVNRCGRDPTLEYAGGSIVVDPVGGVLAEAGAEEQVLTVKVGRGVLDDWRRRFPAWRLRTGRPASELDQKVPSAG